MKENEGVNITGTRLTDPKDNRFALLRIDAWPLPNDPRLHTELMEHARAAIHARLTALGITSSGWHDVHRKQRDQ